ncbi:MAG: S-adenosyl-l-methionine hydroxide adenosyltransferase family protein [Armatimonadota bacterium]
MPPIIALLTDFGYRDAYVGTMKGVLLSRCPAARLVDLTHGVPPQDVTAGALYLQAAAPYFPPDTIFLAVVDPGVGGERRPLCLRSGGRTFVGPDNGLLWPAAAALGRPEAFHLNRPEHWLPRVGCSFHGRDLFAPVAAALASGIPPGELGSPIADPVPLPLPEPRREGETIHGEVLLIDHYGNAITNLGPEHLGAPTPGAVRFEIGPLQLDGPATHYAAVPAGEPLVLLGSFNRYEVAVNGGSAAQRYGLTPGTPLTARQRAG